MCGVKEDHDREVKDAIIGFVRTERARTVTKGQLYFRLRIEWYQGRNTEPGEVEFTRFHQKSLRHMLYRLPRNPHERHAAMDAVVQLAFACSRQQTRRTHPQPGGVCAAKSVCVQRES